MSLDTRKGGPNDEPCKCNGCRNKAKRRNGEPHIVYDQSGAEVLCGRWITVREEATVTMRCLGCGKPRDYSVKSLEAAGIFNPFCPGGECEDRYAARL